MTLDGKAAHLGTMYITVCAPRNATCLNLGRRAKVGSITVPAPALPTFARPSYYQPRRAGGGTALIRNRCCWRRAAGVASSVVWGAIAPVRAPGTSPREDAKRGGGADTISAACRSGAWSLCAAGEPLHVDERLQSCFSTCFHISATWRAQVSGFPNSPAMAGMRRRPCGNCVVRPSVGVIVPPWCRRREGEPAKIFARAESSRIKPRRSTGVCGDRRPLASATIVLTAPQGIEENKIDVACSWMAWGFAISCWAAGRRRQPIRDPLAA